MTLNEELWACALLIEREHGAGARLWIAERIGALAMVGDMAGIERWKAIAARLERLHRPD